jgi:hypothetical protein
MDQHEAAVRELLAAARIPASESECAAAAAALPAVQAGVESLYAIPDARYVDPALRFRADVSEVDW